MLYVKFNKKKLLDNLLMWKYARMLTWFLSNFQIPVFTIAWISISQLAHYRISTLPLTYPSTF